MSSCDLIASFTLAFLQEGWESEPQSDWRRAVAAVREGRVAEAGPPSRSIRRVPKWQDVSCGVWEGAGAARPSATLGRRADSERSGPTPSPPGPAEKRRENKKGRSNERPFGLKTAGGKGLPRNPGHHRG